MDFFDIGSGLGWLSLEKTARRGGTPILRGPRRPARRPRSGPAPEAPAPAPAPAPTPEAQAPAPKASASERVRNGEIGSRTRGREMASRRMRNRRSAVGTAGSAPGNAVGGARIPANGASGTGKAVAQEGGGALKSLANFASRHKAGLGIAGGVAAGGLLLKAFSGGNKQQPQQPRPMGGPMQRPMGGPMQRPMGGPMPYGGGYYG